MALPANDDPARLRSLLARADRKIRDALFLAIKEAIGTHTLPELADLINRGLFEEALDAAIRSGIIKVADDMTGVYVAAGQSAAQFIENAIEVTVSFDQVNERAVRVMQRERLRFIQEFTAEQRAATRDALSDGIRRGLNPRQQAINFRESLGLTFRQQQAVNNYRRLLEEGNSQVLQRQLRDRRFDSSIRRAIAEDTPLTQAQVDRMTSAYQRRYLRYRSEVIGRTEALRAVHQGNNDAFDQAIEEGKIETDQLEDTWNTAGDDIVRDSHAAIDGETIVRGSELFVTPLGNSLRFPGDPSAAAEEVVQCRCVLTTRIAKPKEPV